MKRLLVFFVLILSTFSTVFTQDKNPVKFSGYMFGDYFYNMSRDSTINRISNKALSGVRDFNAFQFRRIYFTYDDEISSSFITRFRLEADQAANTSNGKIGVAVKDAYLNWKNIFSGSDLIFGIQPTPAYEVSEGIWGYRSLEKTIMDLRGIVPSRDLGIALHGRLDEKGEINYWLMIANGDGNSPATSKFKRYYVHIQMKPFTNFQITLYGDLKTQPAINDPASTATPQATVSNNATTAAIFAGYTEKDAYNFGAEGFLQSTSHGMTKSGSLQTRSGIGFSLFGSVNLQKDFIAVARYDYFDPNSDSDLKGDSRNYLILGLTYKPDQRISIIPNFQYETYETPTAGPALTSSLTARVTLYYVFL
jgi:hypothetical protein